MTDQFDENKPGVGKLDWMIALIPAVIAAVLTATSAGYRDATVDRVFASDLEQISSLGLLGGTGAVFLAAAPFALVWGLVVGLLFYFLFLRKAVHLSHLWKILILAVLVSSVVGCRFRATAMEGYSAELRGSVENWNRDREKSLEQLKQAHDAKVGRLRAEFPTEIKSRNDAQRAEVLSGQILELQTNHRGSLASVVHKSLLDLEQIGVPEGSRQKAKASLDRDWGEGSYFDRGYKAGTAHLIAQRELFAFLSTSAWTKTDEGYLFHNASDLKRFNEITAVMGAREADSNALLAEHPPSR